LIETPLNLNPSSTEPNLGNFYAPKLAKNVPECFPNATVFGRWREMARSQNAVGENGYCTDCTPEYQAEMREVGACRYPKTTFHIDSDGFIYGRRAVEDRRVARAEIKAGGGKRQYALLFVEVSPDGGSGALPSRGDNE
jgi:hypothetical protein